MIHAVYYAAIILGGSTAGGAAVGALAGWLTRRSGRDRPGA